MPVDRPNLLLITSDQQHYTTLGVRNSAIRTPHLDRLAAMGTRFDRAYCPNPTCTPTRASLITGQWPSCHGAYTLGTKLPESSPTVGEVLHDAGYRTSLIGKAHFDPLKATPEVDSHESYPRLRDLEYWRTFNETHTPWYGFDRVELGRMHGDEGHVGQHYALWMESKGLDHWRDYFQPRQDGKPDTASAGRLAPPVAGGPGYGWRGDMHWQLPAEFHYCTWIAERTNAEIEAAHAAGQPFFCWSSYHDPHPPYCVPEPWASMYKPDDLDDQVGAYLAGEFDDMPPPHQLTRQGGADFNAYNSDGFGNHGYHPHFTQDGPLTRQHLREAIAIYFGMISFMDAKIGETLDTLERLGEISNTLIVFTSDHGHFYGQHGLIAKGPFHYEDVIRVPFLAAWPGHIPAGVTSKALQTLVDIPATFLNAAGLETPRWMQARSQLADWTGGDVSNRRDAVIVENHHNGEAVHLRTLVTDRYKLTLYRNRDWGELFDFEADPGEHRNRFNDAEYAAVRSEMMHRMINADLDREPAPTERVAGA